MFQQYVCHSEIIPSSLNEKDIDVVIDEIVNNKDFDKSDFEKETYESIEVRFLQEDEDNSIIKLDDIKEKGNNNDKRQALFKRGLRNNFSTFIISQGYHELPKRTIRANGNIYHILKTK